MMIYPLNYPLQRLGINWQLSEYHGWGVFGLNLSLNLPLLGLPNVKLLMKPHENVFHKPQLEASLQEWQKNENEYLNVNSKIVHNKLTVLHSLGNNFAQTNHLHWGSHNIGFIFFELTNFTPRGIKSTNQFDIILAGSRWNANLLNDLGIKRVAYVMQGIDPIAFNTAVNKKFADRFVIFSGGKLEYRKGQDIVLAAFKQFYIKHQDALLITAWNNPWPKITQDLQNSPHGFGVPQINNNRVNIAEWCNRTGLPQSAFIHLDFIANTEMPYWYKQADVALFPNRAEGGTNLVAMEIMASGTPCILSKNTGHMDLIAKNNVYVLDDQKEIFQQNNISSTYGWGESSVDEIIEKLEIAYANKDKNNLIGINGKNFIQQYSWKNQTEKLINICSSIY